MTVNLENLTDEGAIINMHQFQLKPDTNLDEHSLFLFYGTDISHYVTPETHEPKMENYPLQMKDQIILLTDKQVAEFSSRMIDQKKLYKIDEMHLTEHPTNAGDNTKEASFIRIRECIFEAYQDSGVSSLYLVKKADLETLFSQRNRE